MSRKRASQFDYLPGGVPPGDYFRLQVRHLQGLVENAREIDREGDLEHLCFMGLIAYFEAFFSGQFASVVNICPELVLRLRTRGFDTSVDTTNMLEFGFDLRVYVGNMLAEQFDFGSAKKINSLFSALLTVTPFSKKASRKFDEMLLKRHLMVHHGGLYTPSFKKQVKPRQWESRRTYHDSLLFFREDFDDCAKFTLDVARKTVEACSIRLRQHLRENGVRLSRSLAGALALIETWEGTD